MAGCAVFRLPVVLLLLCHACFSQGRVSEFLTVKNWHGTVNITGTGSGSTSGGIFSDVWDFGITTKLDVQLDTYNANIQGWTGTFKGTANMGARNVTTLATCKETFTQNFQGTVGNGAVFTMRLQGTNQYVFYPAIYEAQGSTSTVVLDCAPGTQGGTGPEAFSPVLSDKIQTLPPTGFSLKGSQKVKMNSPLQPQSLLFGGAPAQIDVTIDWDIEPGAQEADEVVILKTSEFQNWRPTAGGNGGRGNPLNLTARLQAKGGGTTNARVAYFIWELTQCSKEPGYAMNAPVQSPSREFDLKIESGAPSLIPLDTLGQKAQTEAGQLTESSVVVAPYDWGAFATIKVTAMMPDGSQIVGYLEGDSAQTEVRLPMRSASSSIADVWKKSHGVDGKTDSADDETDPQGDGTPGDGLTLYEEYRGFMIDGQRVEGDPRKKDYFAVNSAGAFYLGAFRLFKSLSGLAVHYTMKRGEMNGDRVVNFNHDAGAHNGDQHGVIVVPIAANAGYAEAQGGPGPPRSITQIVAPRILPSADLTWINYLVSSLAHELFHACNVYHHGDGPSPSGRFYRDSATNIVYFQGLPATVLSESGDAYPLPADTPVDYQLGAAGDTHIGDDNCLMRYDDARGYFSKSDGHVVYLVDSEPAGLSLCSQQAGTGINDAGRSPQARYGDAVDGRGNCRGQVLVNDNATAPAR